MSQLNEVLKTLRDLKDAGQEAKVLVLAAAVADERFDQFDPGLAKVLALVRAFDTTDDVAADVEKFLMLLQEECSAVEAERDFFKKRGGCS
jgi:hypothetical protein